jgi:hypothetical protein
MQSDPGTRHHYDDDAFVKPIHYFHQPFSEKAKSRSHGPSSWQDSGASIASVAEYPRLRLPSPIRDLSAGVLEGHLLNQRIHVAGNL